MSWVNLPCLAHSLHVLWSTGLSGFGPHGRLVVGRHGLGTTVVCIES